MRRIPRYGSRLKEEPRPPGRARIVHGGRRWEHLRTGLVIGVLIGLICTAAHWLGWSERAELHMLDMRFVTRFLFDGSEVESGPIIIVAIDERSLAAVGRWPWPWREQARLVNALTDSGVIAIGLDILYAEADADGEGVAQLTSALQRNGRVVLAATANAEVPLYPVEPLSGAAAGVGLIDVVTDRDGVIRRLSTRPQLGQPEPFAFALARVVGVMPAEEWAERTFLINYRPVSASARLEVDRFVETVSAIDVMDGIVRDALRGKVAIVGTTAGGFQDRHTTPLLAAVPGVYVHAFALRSLLVDDHVTLSPEWTPYVAIWIIALLGSALAFSVRPWFSAVMAALALSGTLWVSFASFIVQGLWIPVTPIAATVGIVFVSGLAYAHTVVDRDTRRVRSLFRRYVAPEVVDRLLQDAGSVETGRRATVTILFADIRQFTAHAEGVTPEEAVDTLDRYLQVMAEAILIHGGTLDKYIGDAVMAIFGAPLPREDHAEAAIRTAIELRRKVAALGRQHGSLGDTLQVGIGIHSGEAVVGSIGAPNRREYTAIGDVVNVASRLEEAASPGEILLSEATLRAWGVQPPSEGKVMTIRGRKEPILAYSLTEDFSLEDFLDITAAAGEAMRTMHRPEQEGSEERS